MSRLPRPQHGSSPDAKPSAPSLKRKVVPEEDDIEQQPPKKGTGGFRPKPLQASRNATNGNSNAAPSTSTSTSTSTAAKPASAAAAMPRPLTRPRPPVAARPTARGASAPPVSMSTSTIRKPSASRVPASSAVGKRTASGSAAAPDVITNLHKRLTTLESARSQDTERLATLLESQAATTSSSTAAADSHTDAHAADAHAELLAAQAQLASTATQLSTASAQLAALNSELSAAKSALRLHSDTESALRSEAHTLHASVLAGRTALARAEDEAGELRRALAREREEGEIRSRRGERLLREAKEEVVEMEGRVGKLRGELREAVGSEAGGRERCRALESRAAHLAAELQRLEQEKAEREREWAGERAGWAEERGRWEEERGVMRGEAVRGEEERRRLHGMVMELKGNIRVFCRVRPLLPTEAGARVVRALAAEDGEGAGARVMRAEGEGVGAVGEGISAQIAYPDAGQSWPAGQREIVLSSTGAEREWDVGMHVGKNKDKDKEKGRREVWGFGFDRVGIHPLINTTKRANGVSGGRANGWWWERRKLVGSRAHEDCTASTYPTTPRSSSPRTTRSSYAQCARLGCRAADGGKN
ncbi:hypothetical protein DFH06DRAFT_1477173 [Mycena polygramma]|nr:hypothetical protein DFH06DRAFT_1477173 [Mycena polygramma]